VASSYEPLFPHIFPPDFAFPRDPLASGFVKIDEADFTVRKSDIDIHLHVNNVKFIEWAFDKIPDKRYYSTNACEMKARYKKEIKLGARVTLETWEKGDEIISVIKSGDTLNAEIYTRWDG
jgi:acyl-ACP thioesterase